jgi:hypothetical protein
MLGVLLIFVTFCLLLVSFRKAGALPFPTGLIFILFVSQIVFLLVHDGVLTFGMMEVMNYGGLKENYTFIQALYTLIAAFSLLALIGKYETIRSVKIDTQALQAFSKNRAVKKGIVISLIIVFVHFVLFLIITDWEKLWFYPVYLSSIVDQEVVGFLGEAISSTIARSAIVVAVLAAVCFCLSSNSGYSVLKITSGAFAFIYFLFFFSGHSRAAVLVPALIAMNYFVMRSKTRRLLVPLLVFVSFFSLASGLEGRGHPEHGFSSIPANFSRFFSDNMVDESLSVVTNLCEGIFSTAESLQITAPYPRRYKILAFSPLPSLIDGFSDIRKSSQHMLSTVVPVSGIGEVLNFGLPYAVLLAFFYSLPIRIHTSIAKAYPTLFLICNFLILFSFYQLLADALRNGLRFAWIAMFIVLIAKMKAKRNSGSKPPPLFSPPKIVTHKGRS